MTLTERRCRRYSWAAAAAKAIPSLDKWRPMLSLATVAVRASSSPRHLHRARGKNRDSPSGCGARAAEDPRQELPLHRTARSCIAVAGYYSAGVRVRLGQQVRVSCVGKVGGLRRV